MLISDFKPQVIIHGKPGKFNRFIYVVDFSQSSFLIERHIFLNGRDFLSCCKHLSHVFPTYILRCCSGLSFESYCLSFTLDDFESLKKI